MYPKLTLHNLRILSGLDIQDPVELSCPQCVNEQVLQRMNLLTERCGTCFPISLACFLLIGFCCEMYFGRHLFVIHVYFCSLVFQLLQYGTYI